MENTYTKKEAEEYIVGIPRFAAKSSLDNTRNMLMRLGIRTDDGNQFKIIHVAGTNGKGSVCAYMTGTLMNAGKKVGLFTSPHLVSINERIRIGNQPINDELFCEAFEAVKKVSEQMPEEGFVHPSFFEFMLGMAMYVFAKEQVEYIVLETGLGGRLDSTNCFAHPLLTVITSVSLDHMAILGDTVEKIAAEKAGIIKAGVPLVFWGRDMRVKNVLLSKAAELGVSSICVDETQINNTVKMDKFIDFSLKNQYYNNDTFRINSAALYQTINAAVAATALAVLQEETKDADITLKCIKDGICSTIWEGRMEEVRDNVYLDGAHNEDGIRRFIETALYMKDRKQILLFSAVADKAYDAMIKEICESGAFDEYIVCRVSNEHRAAPAKNFAELFKKYSNGSKVYVEELDEDALKLAFSLKSDKDRLFIAGSLYLVGKVKALLEDMNR